MIGGKECKFLRKLTAVKSKIQQWKKDVFGDIRFLRGGFDERIKVVITLEAAANLDTNDIRKIRIKGIEEWDNNLRLFRRIASGRHINKLEREDGSVVVVRSDC